MTDFSAAISAIQQASTLSQIQGIVEDYSAQAVGSGGILYTGEIGAVSAGDVARLIVQNSTSAGVAVNILDNTPRGQFLADTAVRDAIQAAAQNIFEAAGSTIAESQIAAENFLFGSPAAASGETGSLASSLWGQASSEFASSLTGDITVIGTASQANPYRIFSAVEIPTLLDNPNVTSIGGVARSELQAMGGSVLSLFEPIFSQFAASMAEGGIYTSANQTIAVSQETLQALGFDSAVAKTSEQLAADGLERAFTSTALTTAADLLGIAGSAGLKFLGGPVGGAIINLLTSATPANAGEDKALQFLNDYSDVPSGPAPAGSIVQHPDGSQTINMPFNTLDPSGDDLTLTVSSNSQENVLVYSDSNTALSADWITAQSSSSDGAAGDTVQVVYDTGSLPSAAINITDALGNVTSFTISGAPTVQVAPAGGTASGAAGNATVVGFDGSTLNGSSGNELIEAGSNGTVNAGAGTTQVLIDGQNDSVNGRNLTVTGTSASSFFVSGGNDAVTLGGATADLMPVARDINPYGFDPAYYLAMYPDVAASGVDPWQQFLNGGWHEGRNPNAYFDTSWYLAQNPDVAAAGVDPFLHYDEFGWHEGRNPSPLFNTDGYLNSNPDVAAAGVNPLVHYLDYGLYEGRLIDGALPGTSGSSLAADAGGGQTIDLAGTGNSLALAGGSGWEVDGGGDTIGTGGGTGLDVEGGGDTVDLGGSGDALGLLGGSGYMVYGSDSTVNAAGGTSLSADGNNDTFGLGAYTYLALLGGGDTVDASAGDTVSVSGNGQYGTDNTVNLSNGAVSLGDNSRADIDGSGDAVTMGQNASIGLWGNGNTLSAGTGDNVWLGGSGVTVDVSDANFTVPVAASFAISGNGNTVNLDAAGTTLSVGGTGETVYGSGDTIDTSDNASLNAQGGGDTFNLSSNAYLGLFGGGDTVDASAGDTVSVSGNGQYGTDNTVNLSNGAVTLGDNSRADIDGSDDAVTMGQNASIGLWGNGNTLSAGTGDNVWLGGSGVTVDVSDANFTVPVAASCAISGNGNTVNLDAAGTTLSVGGTGETVYGSGDTIDATDNASLNDQGGGDTFNLGSGAYLGLLGGSGYTVYVSNGTVDTWDNTSLNAQGGNDTFGLGSGDYLGLLGGGFYTVYGSNGTVDTWNNTSFNAQGANDTFGLGSGDYLGLLGGGGYTVYGWNSTIDTWNNTAFNAQGGNDTFGLGSDDYLGLLGGGGYTVYGWNSTIDTWDNTAFNAQGGNDTFGLGSGNYLGLLGGSGYWVSGSNDQIEASGNTSFNLQGSGDSVGFGVSGAYVGLFGGYFYNVTGIGDTVETEGNEEVNVTGGNDTIGLGGANGYLGLIADNHGDHVTGSNDTIDTQTNVSFSLSGNGDSTSLGGDSGINIATNGYRDVIYASNDNIVLGNGVTATIYGSYDQVQGSDDAVSFYGNNDLTIGNNDSLWASGSGDFSDGSGDSDSGGESGGSEGGTGYYGGYYGASAALGRKPPGIDVVAQYDKAHGFGNAAAAAAAGYQNALDSAAGLLPVDATHLAGAAHAQWAGHVVTWSFAAGPSDGPAPISGAIQAQYQPVVEQAFADWAAASGLTFQEAADTANPDIRIGWGDFDTADSGLLGYTSYQAAGGLLLPGATIRVEDPSETALSVGADGEPLYAASDASLYQTVLHEIGHALGIGDDSDPNSVMYYALGANNTALNGTDIGAARQIYGVDATAPAPSQTPYPISPLQNQPLTLATA